MKVKVAFGEPVCWTEAVDRHADWRWCKPRRLRFHKIVCRFFGFCWFCGCSVAWL